MKAHKTEPSKNKKLIQSIVSKGENDFSRSPYKSWKGDIARVLIADAAIRRGYKVDIEWGLVFRVSNEDNSWIFAQNTPESSVVASVATGDKHLTKRLLSQFGIPVPVGAVFTDQSAALKYFLSRKRPQVVKPQNSYGGYGVTAGIRDEKAFSTAWQNARARGNRIVIEDFFEGDEVRILVLGGRVVAANCRVPAYVVGDGASSISQLVSEKNKRRKNNPRLRISEIKSFDQLNLDGRSLDEVPAESEYVRLSTVSNISKGGENVAVLDHLHPSIIDIAKKSFYAIPGATLLGLDLLIQDFSARATDENVCMIEVNGNPAIAGPVFVAYGPPSSTLPNDLLDFVASGHYETARRVAWNGKPIISPAPIYNPRCGGESFRGGRSTQVRLLRQAAYARNLLVESLSDELTLISDGERSTGFFQAIPSCTRIVARRASINKEWTKTLLQRANIRTPEGKAFPVEAREDAWQFAQKLSSRVSTVVKPITGSGGKGVSTDIFGRADFDMAWKVASETGTKSILVEEYCPGSSCRLLVIGSAVRAVAERIPAHIVGDGVHTIEQLVASKNEQRRKNPYTGASLIKLAPMTLHKLALVGMGQLSVPGSGQYLQLHSMASIGSGGEARDVTDLLHTGFSVIADKVRKAMYDPLHIGVDLIAEDVTLSPEEQTWAVIGVNANPEFGMHQFNSADLSRDVAGVVPEFGVHQFRSASLSRDVAGALIEAVFPEAQNTSISSKSIRVLIEGKVQDPGFRDWVWRQAHLHMLGGWVRGRRDGRVEALFIGASNAVDQMIKLCGDGPKGGVVTKVDTFDVADEVPRDFKIMDPESNGAARSTRAVQNRTDLAARAAEVADSDRSAAHIRLSSGHEGSVALPTMAGWSGTAARLVCAWFPSFRPIGRQKAFNPYQYLEFFREHNRFNNVGPNSTRRVFGDKILIPALLARLGINTPDSRWIVLNKDVAISSRGERISTSVLADLLTSGRWFVKPRSGEGGHGALLLDSGNAIKAEGHVEENDPAKLLKIFQSGRKFLVQDAIVQSEDYAVFSPTSLNTVRCLTYLSRTGKAEVVAATLRMGNGRSVVDNASSGGIYCGIDLESHRLIGAGLDKNGTTFEKHPATNITFPERKVGRLNETFAACRLAHEVLGGPMTIGWDVAMTDAGPCIVEGNEFWMAELHSRVDPGVRGRLWAHFLRDHKLLGTGFPAELPNIGRRDLATVTFRAKGKVQGVGYRDWMATRAAHRGLDGIPKNLGNGDVEVRLTGPLRSLEFTVLSAMDGPTKAEVSEIEILSLIPVERSYTESR